MRFTKSISRLPSSKVQPGGLQTRIQSCNRVQRISCPYPARGYPASGRISVSPATGDRISGPEGPDLWTLGPGVTSPPSVDCLSTESPLPAGAKAASQVLGQVLGGDVMDQATGGGATRLRRFWEASSKDLVPSKRHEPGLGGVGEPRADTITGWDSPADAADKY